MIQKVLKIGNSLGVTLPKGFVDKNKVKEGARISVVHTNGTITFSPKIPKSTEYEEVSDKKLFEVVQKVDKLYSKALDELANLP